MQCNAMQVLVAGPPVLLNQEAPKFETARAAAAKASGVRLTFIVYDQCAVPWIDTNTNPL